MHLLEIDGLRRAFGGVVAVNDVSFAVEAGETVSLIGPNGAGKTTAFNLITGVDRPNGGQIRLAGERIDGLTAPEIAARGLARTFQNGRVFGNLSVLDNVLIGAHTRLGVARPGLPVVGPLAELLRGLVRPRGVVVEESRLRAEAPAMVEAMKVRHEQFATQMAENLRVIATARAVTEELLTDVANAMSAKERPKTYGASGTMSSQPAAPATGVSINRAL